MKAALLILLACATASISLGQNQKTKSPKKRLAEERVVYEFSGMDLREVMRTLARDIGMSVIVSDTIKEPVHFRLEDMTAREVMAVIAEANELELRERRGVYFVNKKLDSHTIAANRFTKETKLLLDAYLSEGFTREEAMRLIRGLPNGIKLPTERESTVERK